MKTNTSWIQRNSLLGYFALAYAISWSVGIPLALITQGKVNWNIPFSIHYFYAYGPLLSALIMTGLTKGSEGIAEIFKRLTTFQMKPIWWLAAISPLPAFF